MGYSSVLQEGKWALEIDHFTNKSENVNFISNAYILLIRLCDSVYLICLVVGFILTHIIWLHNCNLICHHHEHCHSLKLLDSSDSKVRIQNHSVYIIIHCLSLSLLPLLVKSSSKCTFFISFYMVKPKTFADDYFTCNFKYV